MSYTKEFIEERIEAIAAGNIAMGMPRAEAIEMANGVMETAIKQIVEWGWDRLPGNYGDLMLANEATNPNVREKILKLRAEGATDNDIRCWNNADPLDRSLIIATDDQMRIAAFIGLLEQGRAPELVDTGTATD